VSDGSWLEMDPTWEDPWGDGVLRRLLAERAWVDVRIRDGETCAGLLVHVDDDALLIDLPGVTANLAGRGQLHWVPRSQVVMIRIPYLDAASDTSR
jgi:hypothetical protein